MIARGDNNTRSKDIYDINLLLRGSLDNESLRKLINKVFKVRETIIPKSFAELSNLNTQILEVSWQGYKTKFNGLEFKALWTEFAQSLETIDKKYRG